MRLMNKKSTDSLKDNVQSSGADNSIQNADVKTNRREMLKKVAKITAKAFAAPATIALLTTEAKACSFSC